jgi:hypothetical protein
MPGPATDIDVADDGCWVAICKHRSQLIVASQDSQFALAETVRFPLIRWVGDGEILVVDARTVKGRENAFVFSRSGAEKARFCVGDGVQDVLSTGSRIVVTYFDEGVFGNVAPSHEGLCVFTPDGRLEFGYQSSVRNPVDIADCYCACAAGRHEVYFSPYTGFPLVQLNFKTRQQRVHELPAELAGSSALATDGVTFYFYGPYEKKRSIFRWQPGCAPFEVGTHSGPLRGHFRGKFLSTGESGYTIIGSPGA